jgi:hypothetical protein
MHVLFITANKRFLEENSEERQLLLMMGEVTETLHTVVVTSRFDGYKTQELTARNWIYPTNSFPSYMRYFDILATATREATWQGDFHIDIILSDDPYLCGWAGLRLARKFGRAWMLNVHEYVWGRAFFGGFSLTRAIPIKALLQDATHVCVFSPRARIHLERFASEVEKQKLFSIPALYTAPTTTATIDIKAKYPEFNYTLVAFAPYNSSVDRALRTLKILRAQYPKAGLVFVTWSSEHTRTLRAARRAGLGEWVRVEEAPKNTFPFIHASACLYVASGDEEDDFLIHAASASCPLVALRSPISESIIEHGTNGILVDESPPQALAGGVRTLNETPGLREKFHVNASMRILSAIPSRESIVEVLRAALTFPIDTSEPMPKEPDTLKEFVHIPTLWERVVAWRKEHIHGPRIYKVEKPKKKL